MNPNQTWVVNLVKVFVTLLLSFIIYKTIGGYGQELEWPKVNDKNLKFLLIALLLLPVNLLLESKRWRFVMQNIGNDISIKKAFSSIVIGSSLSMITPFRIGDYAGRMLLLRSDHRKTSVYATLMCSVFLNLINISIGIVACLFIFQSYKPFLSEMWALVLLNSFVVFMVVLLIINFDKIINRIFSIPWLSRKVSIDIDDSLNTRGKFTLLLLSFFRYCVYVTQYVLILYFLNVDNTVIELVACISIIYFIQSAVPLPAFLSFIARVEIALLVWKILVLPISTVLAGTAILWVINLMMPALLGLVLIIFKWR